MKTTLRRTLVACVVLGMSFLTLSAKAQHDVLGTATIYYDSQTNTMSASCVMDPAYGVETYYGAQTECAIYDVNNNVIEWGYNETTEYDLADFTPNYDMQYHCYGWFWVFMRNYDYQNFGSYYWDWYDPYFFYFYNFYPGGGDGGSYDWWGYPYYGRNETEQQIYLGSVVAQPDTTPPGPAHHVKVISDSGSAFPANCSSVGVAARQMLMQVVDVNGVAIATDASVEETFSSPTNPTSSCASPFGGSPVAASCSPTGYQGTTGAFLDTMSVGNSTSWCSAGFHTSSCGYSQTSTWSACSGGDTNTLWISPRVTHANSVSANGQTAAWTIGHPFNPGP